MNSVAKEELVETGGYQPSTVSLREFSWDVVDSMRRRLEGTVSSNEINAKVSRETAEWASQVVLQILPRNLLRGAEVDVFEDEIHVSWNSDRGGVTAFFTPQRVLKIYTEWLENGSVTHHDLCSDCTPMDITHAVRGLRTSL